ncbi:MAG: amidohydrolase [Lachnospiraceae bacterium]|nr:amidohydrolase [Lachnospiraceae bacterium]
MIIDFHTHIFPDKISASVIKKLAIASRTKAYTDGSAAALTASMKQAGVDLSVNMPVMTRPDQVEKINTSMIRSLEQLLSNGLSAGSNSASCVPSNGVPTGSRLSDGISANSVSTNGVPVNDNLSDSICASSLPAHAILPFGGMHPDYPDYRAELKRLAENHIPGIKLHPAYQQTDLDDIRFLRIIECACENGLIVLTHAGLDIGLPEKNYATVPQILKVIDTVHPDKFVLAHMGNWAAWDEVERDLAGAPVWLDTAFSIGRVEPNPDVDEPPMRDMHLTDEDFVRLARKHGTDRVLFATDSPWADQAEYVGYIRRMPFSEEEKSQIFYENAKKLLRIF